MSTTVALEEVGLFIVLIYDKSCATEAMRY